jgi:hypothetical protein
MPAAPFWSIELDVRVADWEALDGSWSGVSYDGMPEQAGEFRGQLTWYERALDEAYWEGTGDDSEYASRYRTDGGEMANSSDSAVETLQGSVDTIATDLSGNELGTLSFQVSAARCAALEDI